MINIALLGDRSDEVIAHRAIPLAIQLTADHLNLEVSSEWIHSNDIASHDLSRYQRFWCVPASPYKHTKNIIDAIQFARESGTAFLGTCGGYQHAVLEYAQNVLGYQQAASAENDPNTTLPLINAMFCSLREKPGQIIIKQPSRLYSYYQDAVIEEQYNCGFGLIQNIYRSLKIQNYNLPVMIQTMIPVRLN